MDDEERRDHACLLFRTEPELKGYLLPFLKDGLRNGEHCLFVCPEDAVDDWLLEFQATGIDVVGLQESGALLVATGEQWRATPFNSVTKARDLWSHIDGKLADFHGVRIAGFASWTQIEPTISAGDVCHWEATADLIYEDEPVKTVCIYDLNLHEPSDIRAALRTHPKVILDRQTFRNPHYESPQIIESEPHLNNSDADTATIDAMLQVFQATKHATQ